MSDERRLRAGRAAGLAPKRPAERVAEENTPLITVHISKRGGEAQQEKLIFFYQPPWKTARMSLTMLSPKSLANCSGLSAVLTGTALDAGAGACGACGDGDDG